MRSVTSGILSGCSDLAGRRCGFRAPCGLFHTPAAVEPCRKTAKKRENGLCISKTAYHAACFSTRFSTGCGKVLPSCVGNGKENVGLRRGGLPRLAAVVPGGGAWRFWLPVDFAAVVPEGVACFLCRLPTLPSVYFFAPYPPSPLPRRGRGRLRLFHARGFAPCIPGAEPGRHRSRGRIARWRRGLPPRFSFHALTGAAGCDILVYRTEPPRRTARKQKETPYRTAIPERRKGENRA